MILLIKLLLFLSVGIRINALREWKTLDESTVKLSLVAGQEFPIPNFNPPMFVRKDGAKFISIALIDHPDWIPLALNSFISLFKVQPSHAVTIVTVNDPNLTKIFERLGFYTYDAGHLVKTFPPDFQAGMDVPSWSWGRIIFLRYNMMLQALMRRVGFCSLDLDVTYNKNVFFEPMSDGTYPDIATQGEPRNIELKSTGKCGFLWKNLSPTKVGHYLNPGLSCHAPTNRTLQFMYDLQEPIYRSIREKIPGWGQPAYMEHVCSSGFEFTSSGDPLSRRFTWQAVSIKRNVSISMFKGLSSQDPEVVPSERSQVPVYHAKACFGKDVGNVTDRVVCKETWLRSQKQWFLPDNLPTSMAGWLAMPKAEITALANFIHGRHSHTHHIGTIG